MHVFAKENWLLLILIKDLDYQEKFDLVNGVAKKNNMYHTEILP